MNRKTTPDILGEIMGSLGAGNKAIKHESNKPIKQDHHKTIKPVSDKTTHSGSALKEKATFNLSLSLLEQLEGVWVKLRKEKKGTRVTKTLIVEKALQIAVNDYESRCESSDLFKKLTTD